MCVHVIKTQTEHSGRGDEDTFAALVWRMWGGSVRSSLFPCPRTVTLERSAHTDDGLLSDWCREQHPPTCCRPTCRLRRLARVYTSAPSPSIVHRSRSYQLHRHFAFSQRCRVSTMHLVRHRLTNDGGNAGTSKRRWCSTLQRLLPSYQCFRCHFQISRKLFMTLLEGVRGHEILTSNARRMPLVRLASSYHNDLQLFIFSHTELSMILFMSKWA
jgi:hypothetical protein